MFGKGFSIPNNSPHPSLHFEEDIKETLLSQVSIALVFSLKSVDANIIGSNRLILLHGPPGTGSHFHRFLL